MDGNSKGHVSHEKLTFRASPSDRSSPGLLFVRGLAYGGDNPRCQVDSCPGHALNLKRVVIGLTADLLGFRSIKSASSVQLRRYQMSSIQYVRFLHECMVLCHLMCGI